MAKKRSTGRKKSKGVDWPALWAVSARAGVALLLIGLAVAMTLGVTVLRGRAAEAMAAETPDGSGMLVTFDWPRLSGGEGTWLPERDQAALLDAAENALGLPDPLSPAPLRSVSSELGRTGWFRQPPVARMVAPAVVRIEGEWRQPAAVVRWQGRDHLISVNAMPMPPVYQPGGSSLPVILGATLGPASGGGLGSRYAQPWPGIDVRSGLDLLVVLNRAGLLGQVAGVDVIGYARSAPLEIVTTHGTRVVWGSPPDEWKPGERSVEERLQRLRELIDRTGRIDGGADGIAIHGPRVEIDRTGG